MPTVGFYTQFAPSDEATTEETVHEDGPAVVPVDEEKAEPETITISEPTTIVPEASEEADEDESKDDLVHRIEDKLKDL